MQKRARFQKLIPQIGYFFPFTPYFLLFLIGTTLAYIWLSKRPLIPDTPFYEIFSLLIQITLIFGFFLLAFSFLSVLIAWIFLFYQLKTKKLFFKITSSVKYDNSIHIEVHPILKPLFGFIKFRLRYNNDEYSPKFQLTEAELNDSFFNTKLNGYYKWDLPEIKEYTIDQSIVFLEDIFQFFSFAIKIYTHERFHSVPPQKELEVDTIHPKTTENIISRIDYIKKVEGDHLNYKSFENDDIRRIVWKIYAKNRELVVRTPESLDPYSSHIYLFASFFAGFDIEGNETVHIPFLNYYKTMVWNIYEELKKQNPNIRFISDQSDKYILSSEEDSDSKLKHLISVSSWQQHTNLKSYLEGHHPSVIIVSSLNNAEVVEQLLRDAEDDTTFLFIPLTASLQKQRVTDIVEILFIKKDSDNLSKYKPQWVLSPLRTKINENEKKIKKLLNIED